MNPVCLFILFVSMLTILGVYVWKGIEYVRRYCTEAQQYGTYWFVVAMAWFIADMWLDVTVWTVGALIMSNLWYSRTLKPPTPRRTRRR